MGHIVGALRTKSGIAAIAAAMLLVSTADGFAKCRTFENAPKTFENMNLMLHQKLKALGDGVVIKFGGQGRILSIIQFDRDQDVVTDELLMEELRSAAKTIKYATEQRGDEVISSAQIDSWSVGQKTFHAETVRATYKVYDVTAHEFVGLSHDTKCFFKVRFTNAADADDASALERYKAYVAKAHALLLKPDTPEEPASADTVSQSE